MQVNVFKALSWWLEISAGLKVGLGRFLGRFFPKFFFRSFLLDSLICARGGRVCIPLTVPSKTVLCSE